MTIFDTANAPETANSPVMLIIPGIDNSGPAHWQSLWEEQHAHAYRVNMESWTQPHRNSWVTRLNLAVTQAERPLILVAHSLGCHAVAWWAALADEEVRQKVAGALLVAPPEVDAFPTDHRLASFGPTPKAILPFPSIFVASRNDPYVQFDRARALAGFWGSRFVDGGYLGHINAETGLGAWEEGQQLAALVTSHAPVPPTLAGLSPHQHWPSSHGVSDSRNAVHGAPVPLTG